MACLCYVHGIPCYSMDFHGIPWLFVDGRHASDLQHIWMVSLKNCSNFLVEGQHGKTWSSRSKGTVIVGAGQFEEVQSGCEVDYI